MTIPLYFSAKAYLLCDHHFLGLMRADDELDYYDLPGGRMQYGERLKETLVREVLEETGIMVKPHKILGSWDLIEKHRQISGIIYLCTAKNTTVQLSTEHVRYKWIPKKDISFLYPVLEKCLKNINSDGPV